VGKCFRDTRQDAIEVAQDFVVAEAQHTEVAQLQGFIAPPVIFVLLVMDRAINLDNEVSTVAVEINNEAIDALLATELERPQVMAAQVLPEVLLRRGHLATQFSRPVALLL
jgi:hypothetical protein